MNIEEIVTFTSRIFKKTIRDKAKNVRRIMGKAK